MNKDTLIVTPSDMHTGSTTALCPDRFMTFMGDDNNHTPNSKQVKIAEHFKYCAGEVAKARKDKAVLIVHNGDAIEGRHHNYTQLLPCSEQEQAELHEELMGQFKKWIDFDGRRGDKLYYTMGTETHTKDWEYSLAKKLNAIETDDGQSVFHDLKLDVNGKRIWWTHHGPAAGKGANKGNAMRNWLRDRFYDARDEGQEPPHMVITSHTHNPFWQIYVGRYKGEYFPVRGLITPSWQQKTRYANGKAPIVINKIGLQYFTIYKDGTISDPTELVMKT